MKKIKSRKLWVTVLYALLSVISSRYGLNLPLTEIGAVAGTYILGESAIDLMKKQ